MMDGEFEHTQFVGPVTALAMIVIGNRPILLSGEGNNLKILDQGRQQVLTHSRVFRNQTIFGVVVDKPRSITHGYSRLIIWGGSLIRFAQLQFSNWRISYYPGYQSLSPGCILDGRFCSFKLSECDGCPIAARAAVLTSQDGLTVLDFQDSPEITCHQHLLGGSNNSILYSGHIRWLSYDKLLVATGTAFGEVSLKLHSLKLRQGISTITSQLAFKAHEGSVFDVRLSEKLPSSCGNQGAAMALLASCSDDRSLRIWNVSKIFTYEARTEQHRSSLITAPDTGFGFEDRSCPRGQSICQLLAKAWGHSSRIWEVHFLSRGYVDESQSSYAELATVGEDATVQYWRLVPFHRHSTSLSPSDETHFILERQRTLSIHVGKNVWSFAYALHNQTTLVVASGGADGQIVSMQLNKPRFTRTGSARDSNVVRNAGSDELSISVDRPWRGRLWKSAAMFDDFREKDMDSGAIVHPARLSKYEAEELRTISGSVIISGRGITRKLPGPIKKFMLVNSDQLLSVDDEGTLLLASIHKPTRDRVIATLVSSDRFPDELFNEHRSTWTCIAQLSALRTYATIATSHDAGISFVAAADSSVYFLAHRSCTISLLERRGDRVANVLCQSSSDWLNIIVSYQSLASFSYWRIPIRYNVESITPVEVLHALLPTSFKITSILVLDDLKTLLLGSRAGTLAAYSLELRSITHSEASTGAAVIPQKFLGTETITSITRLSSKGNPPWSHLILTTSRDGSYAIYQVVCGSEALLSDFRFDLVALHHSSPMAFSTIEGAHFSDHQLILHGFRGKHFVVWNETMQREVMIVDCGGAHRLWDFHPGPTGESFTWMQASRIYQYSQASVGHRVEQTGSHGREIKALTISPVCYTRLNTPQRILATGAEDTTIRLVPIPVGSRLGTEKATVLSKCSSIMKKHTTGIQALRWSSCGRYLFSSGGYEDFFVWRIRHVPGFGVGFLCEAACPYQNALRDLRITSFDVSTIWEVEVDKASVVTSFLLSMVYSDSFIRLFIYHCNSQRFDLLCTGTYSSTCLTQVSQLFLENGLLLCSASSEGCLAIWDINRALNQRGVTVETAKLFTSPTSYASTCADCISSCYRTKVHQSAILAMKSIRVNEHLVLVVTGGEDNALGVSQIIYNRHSSRPISCSTLIVTRAHACAITAIAVFQECALMDSKRSRYRIATSGTDQRLKIWSITVDSTGQNTDSIEVRVTKNVFTSVADVADLDIIEDDADTAMLFVAGVGLDIWALKNQSIV